MASKSSKLLYCRVPWSACVEVRGADALDFLRRQLTQNPPVDAARFAFAAWSDARGRVRALVRVVHVDDRLVLITERQLLDSVLAKLKMFVLRSDVEIVADEESETAAIVGDSADWLAAREVELAPEPGAAARSGRLSWLRLGPELVHVIGPAAELDRLGDGLTEGSPEQVELAEIRLGLPRIGAALTERYVPQMLNLERLDAVSFDKGCYPGQEVVARLHHRGSVKRRMRRFESRAAPSVPEPGTPLVTASGEPAGDVERAARHGDGLELLAVVPLDAADTPLRIGDAHGPELAPAPLPYDAD